MHQVPKVAVRSQTIALIPVFMNVLVMGYGFGWITNAVYFYSFGTELNFSPDEITLIASFYEVGRIVFAIPAGLLTDVYGRTKIIICTSFTHFLSWLLLSFSTSAVLIYISRFASGISVAMLNATSLISIGEISSPEKRGKFTSLYIIFMYIGENLPSITTAILPSYHLLSYNITVISFVCLVLSFWMMETPNYLVSVSKHDQARHNLKRVRPGYSEDDISHEFEKLQKYIEEERSRKRISWSRFMTSKSIAKPLSVFILINFFTTFTGYPVIWAYMTVIYPEIGCVSKQYYPLIIEAISLLPLFATPFYIEKFTRRSIFMTAAAAASVMNAVCAITYFCYSELKEDYFKWPFIISDLFLGIIFSGFLQSMNSAMKTELLPQSIKGIGGSLGVIAQALAFIILYQMYSFISENLSIYYIVYVVFSGNSLILCLLVFFLLPEGRGKFLADIQAKFSGKPPEPVTCKI